MPGEKTLFKFNIQNAKYAVKDSNGDWTEPVSFGTAKKISLEGNVSKKAIYGDGKKIADIINDKGLTGTLTLNNVPDSYEIAMGRKVETTSGLADVAETASVPHCIYFEICAAQENGGRALLKAWLYNCTSSRAAEAYDQTEDEINVAAFDIPLEISGIELTDETGEPYQVNGVTRYVSKLTVAPGDENFETFGDEVRLPVISTEA